MIDSRSLDDLLPEVKSIALKFIERAKEEGIDVLIYCTYRDDECQNALYAKGRTKPGPIVTNARAGESWHNHRRAWDCVPLVGGKAQWNDSNAYAKLGRIGESLGLEWAGRWSGKLKETAHFQFTGGKTLKQLIAARSIKGAQSEVAS